MLAEGYWPTITVARDVFDRENRHCHSSIFAADAQVTIRKRAKLQKSQANALSNTPVG